MTKEQEKAIEGLKSLSPSESDIETVLNMLKEKDAKMKIQEENYKNLIADIEMIAKELGLEEDGTIDEIYVKVKEKDKQIAKYEKIYKEYDCYRWVKELNKKDKIIDLMAEHINYLSDELIQATGKNELEFCNGNKSCGDSDYSCEQCIKQYFERKVKNEN